MAQKVAGVEVQLSANSARLLSELERSRREITSLRKSVQDSSNRIRYAFNKLRRAAQVVASAFIFTAGIRSMLGMVAAMKQAEDAVKLMQARFQQFARAPDAFARIYDLANKLGVSMDEAANGMTRLLVATKTMGTSQKVLEDVYENIVVLGRAGGTSAEEMKGAMRQLSQGLASGKLAGEELRSVLENLPLVAIEISRQLGIDIGQIRQFGADGKITGQVVVDALREIEIKLEDLPETFSMQTERMKTEWQLLLAAMGDEIATSGLMGKINDLLKWTREDVLLDFATRTQGELVAMIADVETRLAQLKADRAKVIQQGGAEFTGEADIARAKEELDALYVALEQTIRKLDELWMRKDVSAAANEVIMRTREQLRETDPTTYRKIIEIDKEQLKKDFDRMWQEFEEVAEGEDFLKPFIMRVGKMPPAMKKATDEMSEYSRQAARNIQDAFAQFLFDPFEDGLKGMVDGFLTAIRTMIANQLAARWFGPESAIGSFIGGLFGGARAAGGPVSFGKTYLVGEEGPELFTPARSGMIIPAGATAGVTSGVTITQYNDFSGVDEASVYSRIVPALRQTKEAAVAEVRHLIDEGRLR